MAKERNKTDHVLNLLSSGGKKSAAKKEAKEVKEEPPAEIITDDEFDEDIEEETEMPEKPVKKGAGKKNTSKKKANVAVVYKTAEEDSPIAEAVKDSLEQELNAFLKEKETQLQENVAKAEAKVKEDVEKNSENKEAAKLETTDSEEDEEKDEAVKTAREKIKLAELDVRALMTQVQEEEETEEVAVSGQEPELEEIVKEDIVETPVEEIREEPKPGIVNEVLSAQQGLIDDVVDEADYVTLNIMEILVKRMAPELVRQFGHCDCRRCMADTIALALTNLPAKYVVVDKGTESPLINFYERKYSGQLTVEITKASMIVHENPHH